MFRQNPAEEFEVRDLRAKEKFYVDDVYLNGYARLCGASASMVYIALCRHADKQQTCFPSMNLISEKTALSRRTVVTSIKILSSYKIIGVSRDTRTDGKYGKNTYILLDKSQWTKDQVQNLHMATKCKKRHEPCANNDSNQVQPLHTKETHMEGNTYKGIPAFESIWSKYPKRLGKKEALRHYKQSVKSEKEASDIHLALGNYIAYIKSKGIGEQFIKHGSSWFNNWQDWLDMKPEHEQVEAKKSDLIAQGRCTTCKPPGRIVTNENGSRCESCNAEYKSFNMLQLQVTV